MPERAEAFRLYYQTGTDYCMIRNDSRPAFYRIGTIKRRSVDHTRIFSKFRIDACSICRASSFLPATMERWTFSFGSVPLGRTVTEQCPARKNFSTSEGGADPVAGGGE